MLVNCFTSHCFYKNTHYIKTLSRVFTIFFIPTAILLLLPSQPLFIFGGSYLPSRKENLNTAHDGKLTQIGSGFSSLFAQYREARHYNNNRILGTPVQVHTSLAFATLSFPSATTLPLLWHLQACSAAVQLMPCPCSYFSYWQWVFLPNARDHSHICLSPKLVWGCLGTLFIQRAALTRTNTLKILYL